LPNSQLPKCLVAKLPTVFCPYWLALVGMTTTQPKKVLILTMKLWLKFEEKKTTTPAILGRTMYYIHQKPFFPPTTILPRCQHGLRSNWVICKWLGLAYGKIHLTKILKRSRQ
jgi:hypothetical protein